MYASSPLKEVGFRATGGTRHIPDGSVHFTAMHDAFDHYGGWALICHDHRELLQAGHSTAQPLNYLGRARSDQGADYPLVARDEQSLWIGQTRRNQRNFEHRGRESLSGRISRSAWLRLRLHQADVSLLVRLKCLCFRCY